MSHDSWVAALSSIFTRGTYYLNKYYKINVHYDLICIATKSEVYGKKMCLVSLLKICAYWGVLVSIQRCLPLFFQIQNNEVGELKLPLLPSSAVFVVVVILYAFG